MLHSHDSDGKYGQFQDDWTDFEASASRATDWIPHAIHGSNQRLSHFARQLGLLHYNCHFVSSDNFSIQKGEAEFDNCQGDEAKAYVVACFQTLNSILSSKCFDGDGLFEESKWK